MEKYCIPTYNDVHEFLSLLAHRLGRLKKGTILSKIKVPIAILLIT